MPEMLLRLTDVHFGYGPQRPVLSGCGFALAPGERVALRGPNGSGKTTLLHLIVGLLKPVSGQIEAFGRLRTVEADFHEVRRRVGLLFQDADDQLFCPTVAEDLAFGPLNLGRPRGEVRQIVAARLAELGLSGYEQRITHKLSGGEKRLVALAAVLAMDPEVLLLDEPVNALDDAATARLVEIVNRLPQAMVIVSHDRDFLRQTTNATLRLCDGRLIGLPRLASPAACPPDRSADSDARPQ
jgi:cobalt/nickel transport system ATP-binding protein